MDGKVLMITYEVYEEVLKVWNHELPDDFEICSELYSLTNEQMTKTFPSEEEIVQMCREKYSELSDADDEFFLENPALWPFNWEECLYV